MDSPEQLALNCADLAREIVHGPRLFDDLGHPTAAVERYNGSRVTRDAERCVQAGALRLLAYSDRQIAEVLRCDVRSIPLMVREAEKSGRIPALKERLVQLVGHNAEQSSIVLAQLLDRAAGGSDSLELSGMIKAVGQVNSFQVEKHQLLTGAATERIEVTVGAGEEERRAWALANCIEIPAETGHVDVDSTQNTPERQQTLAIPPARHADDTWPAASTSPATASAPEPAATRTPGGGVDLPPAGLETPTVSPGSKF